MKQTKLKLGLRAPSASASALKRKSSGQSQPFARLVVLDFEATCDDRGKPDLIPQEIIEFSAVILDTETLQILGDPFQRYVQPTEHPVLTPFCTQLTGIQQSQVESAQLLPHVLRDFEGWLLERGCFAGGGSPTQAQQTFAPLSWTNWDLQVQLESELKWRQVKRVPWLRRWINLKVAFEKRFGKPGSLQQSLAVAGLEWTHGRAHSGVVDAVNTARLAAELMRLGDRLELTGWFDDAAPRSKALKQRTVFGFKPPPPKKHKAVDENGELTGLCVCGKKAQLRTVKRPGTNHGKQFWSCGNWQITGGKTCDFFHWVDETPQAKKVAAAVAAVGEGDASDFV